MSTSEEKLMKQGWDEDIRKVDFSRLNLFRPKSMMTTTTRAVAVNMNPINVNTVTNAK